VTGIADAARVAGLLALHRGDPETTAVLTGAFAHILEDAGLSLFQAHWHHAYMAATQRLRAVLGGERFDEACSRGALSRRARWSIWPPASLLGTRRTRLNPRQTEGIACAEGPRCLADQPSQGSRLLMVASGAATLLDRSGTGPGRRSASTFIVATGLGLVGGWLSRRQLHAREARLWRTKCEKDASAVIADRDVHGGALGNDGARAWVLLNDEAFFVGCADHPSDSPKP
jgi:hypothetical protein